MAVPSWDLSVVLEGLVAASFEPLESAPEQILTLKVTLLLALTSLKRVGDLQALFVSEFSLCQWDLQFGFMVAGTDAEPLPQCVICADLLANDSMKPCKLKRHLETKHPTFKDKPLDFFKLQLSGLEQQKCNLSKHTSVSNTCLEASYYVSKWVAEVGKPHTIAEALILPAAKDICQVMFGDNFAQQISDIPLSNGTVSCRISDMASDSKE